MPRHSFLPVPILLACAVFEASLARGDDAPASPPSKPAPLQPAPSEPEAKPKADPAPERKTDLRDDLKGLTEDLFDLVVGPKKDKKDGALKPSAPTGEKDPIESAIEGMRNAQKRIAEKDTSAKTREVQEQVVKDLEKLIEQAKKPPQSPPPQSQNSQDQNQNPQDRKQGQGRKNSPQPEDGQKTEEEKQSDSGEAPGRQKSESEKARESSDEARAAREREAEMARRRDLVKDVWGHLPPALRQKLLNVSSDKSLPKYDELIRRYFESLAEEGGSKPRRAPESRNAGF